MIARAVMIALAAGLACDGTTGGGGQGPHGPRDPADPPVIDAALAPAVPIDAAAAVDADAAPAPPAPALVAPPGSLDALFAALHAAEAHADDGRVLISVFGDSHTAGDWLTQRLRNVLQARFGDAGRGVVAAGKPPYSHYDQRDLQYGSTGSWKALIGGRRADPEPYGLLGFRVATKKKAEAWVEAAHVARFDVLYYKQPGGGPMDYRVDGGAWKTIKTKAAHASPETLAITAPDGAHRLTLRHGKQGTLDLFGIALERDQPGVVVDGMGIVGRRVGHLAAWDWSVIGQQLAKRDPRLVIVQYGTNEADDPELDLDRVAAQWDTVLGRIRAAAPGASVLVLGPPDMQRRAAGKACDKHRPSDGVETRPECQWKTPDALLKVIEVERAAAARAGVAFFDTFAAMGGGDHMDGWSHADPRVAYGDHVHFTSTGYGMWADALLAELLAAYDAGDAPAAGGGG